MWSSLLKYDHIRRSIVAEDKVFFCLCHKKMPHSVQEEWEKNAKRAASRKMTANNCVQLRHKTISNVPTRLDHFKCGFFLEVWPELKTKSLQTRASLWLIPGISWHSSCAMHLSLQVNFGFNEDSNYAAADSELKRNWLIGASLTSNFSSYMPSGLMSFEGAARVLGSCWGLRLKDLRWRLQFISQRPRFLSQASQEVVLRRRRL